MKTVSRIIIAVLAVAIAVGIAVICIVLTTNNSIKIKLDDSGVTQAELKFSANGLEPTESREYSILLQASSSGTYNVTLEFVGEKSILGDFVDVTVEYEGGKAENSLANLLNGETVEFTCEITKKSAIKIIYTMPEDTGNEAQGASADFDILLTVAR